MDGKMPIISLRVFPSDNGVKRKDRRQFELSHLCVFELLQHAHVIG